MAAPVRDSHGFVLDAAAISPYQSAQEAHDRTVLPRQRKAWAEVQASADAEVALRPLRKSGKLKAMVRNGIPNELRRRVWPVMCGASAKRAALDDPGYYTRLLTTSLPTLPLASEPRRDGLSSVKRNLPFTL